LTRSYPKGRDYRHKRHKHEDLSIPTLPPEYKQELALHLKEKNLGETLNDLLENAKQRNVHIFPVPYMNLLSQIGEKLGIPQLSRITRMINVLTIGVSFDF